MRMRMDPETFLSRYLLPTTMEEAEAHVSSVLETATLFSLCQQHLPHRFNDRFSQTWVADQEALLPNLAAGRPWSKGELACLELISEHLVPFHYEHLEMVADEEGERLPTIPLMSMGIELGDGSERDRHLGWRILDVLHQVAVPTDGSPFPPGVRSALARMRRYHGTCWSWDVFKTTCAAFEEPLCHLWQVLQLFDHSTDNLFLDPTYEQPVEDATWTQEDLELLIRHWREAQHILEQGDALADWLAADPQRVRKGVDLWNLATWHMLMQ